MWVADAPVVPDTGNQRDEALRHSGEHPVRGAATALFEVELALEALVDGLDPLPDSAWV